MLSKLLAIRYKHNRDGALLGIVMSTIHQSLFVVIIVVPKGIINNHSKTPSSSMPRLTVQLTI